MNEFLTGILNRFREVFDPDSLGEAVTDLVANVIVGLTVFAIVLLLWWFLGRLIRRTLDQSHLDETASSFIYTVAKYACLSVGVVYALNAASIDTGAVLASLGIAGLTIGFAARDALSNLISGVLIFLDRPFVIGDLVEIEDHYGRVDKITLRSTRIVTRDGKMLAVPNTEVINKTVASYTNFPHLRLDVGATIGVHENVERVRQILLGLVQEDEDFLSDPPPRVVVTQLNDYNVAVELQVWLIDETQHVEKRFDLRERLFKRLTESGVDMPFETIQLAPLEVNMLGRAA